MKDLKITWDPPASLTGIDELHIFRKEGDHSAVTDLDLFRSGATKVAAVAGGAVEYIDAQVSVGSYTYGVFSYNSSGYGPGDLANEVFEVIPNPPQSGPTDLAAASDSAAPTFQSLGLDEPQLGVTSGGACEWSTNSETFTGPLYCPTLEFGGMFQSTFYHNGRAAPYDLPHHSIGTSLRSSVFDIVVFDDWYHVVLTRDGLTGAMYINGQLISVGAVMKNTALQGSPGQINVGAVASSNWSYDYAFNGKIDQTSVWNRNLSTAEAQALYNNGDGIPYGSWSESLKQEAEYVIEVHDADATQITNSHEMVAGNSFSVNSAGSISRPHTQPGGKVSTTSFTPVYHDPFTPANLSGSLAPISSTQQRHSIRIGKGLSSGEDASWSLAAWVAPHGQGFGSGTNSLATVNYKGTSYRQARGTIFSEYNHYSNYPPDANFIMSFHGLFE